MSNTNQIYVRLLNENVEVWRPIQAEKLPDGNYRIVNQQYDREIESWEFNPGDIVVCEYLESGGGRFLAAARKA